MFCGEGSLKSTHNIIWKTRPCVDVTRRPTTIVKETKLFPLGFEPRTFRVLGERDNHYTTETDLATQI